MPTSNLTRSPTGLYELHIEGRFAHPHWISFLFSGLSQQKISIVSGRAEQNARLEWNARFDLDFRLSMAVPRNLDYVAMAEKNPPATDAEMPRLSKFEVKGHARGIEVLISGPDQVGFLGRLMRKLSLLALFPVEIDIDTVSGVISDRIVLQTIGGGAVSESVRTALGTLLRDLVWRESNK